MVVHPRRLLVALERAADVNQPYGVLSADVYREGDSKAAGGEQAWTPCARPTAMRISWRFGRAFLSAANIICIFSRSGSNGTFNVESHCLKFARIGPQAGPHRR
jgi:hypothetical protein